MIRVSFAVRISSFVSGDCESVAEIGAKMTPLNVSSEIIVLLETVLNEVP